MTTQTENAGEVITGVVAMKSHKDGVPSGLKLQGSDAWLNYTQYNRGRWDEPEKGESVRLFGKRDPKGVYYIGAIEVLGRPEAQPASAPDASPAPWEAPSEVPSDPAHRAVMDTVRRTQRDDDITRLTALKAAANIMAHRANPEFKDMDALADATLAMAQRFADWV